MADSSSSERPALIIFQELLNELPDEDPKKLDAKVRRKLTRAGLGPYDQSAVDQLRALHDVLRAEIGKMQHSQYYRGTAGRMAER